MSASGHSIHFYNTETNRKDPFTSLEPGKVKMYTCGPTVYDYAHIGNYRAYLFEDILRRYLKYRGYQVTQVMNLTDVEDKIIRKSIAQSVSISEVTKPFIEAFFQDLDTLHVERAEYYPKATDHVDEMLAIIRKLRDAGYTYEKDGSVYFRISQFKNYGRLSGIKVEDVKIGARIDSDEYEKDDARDFVLWKAYKEGEHFWETEFGKGRPGWHIECSAMATKYLGNHFDIHTGGEDNIFPHHENEIAQSEAATGETFVNYWLHCRHLLVEGEKMSKSKGNFFTLRDLIGQGHHPMAIRYFIISNHYRSPVNLTQDALKAAHSAWTRIMDFHTRLQETITRQDTCGRLVALDEDLGFVVKKFEEHMDDDLDTPRALAALFDFIRDTNKLLDEEPVNAEQTQAVLDALQRMDSVLGVIQEEETLLDAEIETLIQERQEARKAKNFTRADAIRDTLAEQGIILEDTRDGVRWKRR
ncbi:MAG: cysteine--tRNA ligase [bacterium]|jgi:cysteinyl-tRNA synthetase|nr:cysteine--tRNA ligase [bacterium]